jgi:hypothetical protein
MAEKRLIGLPIPDIQQENPRAVGKGRLLTPSRLMIFPIGAAETAKSGPHTAALPEAGVSGHSRPRQTTEEGSDGGRDAKPSGHAGPGGIP